MKISTMPSASRHFLAMATLIEGEHHYYGDDDPVAALIRSWPDGAGEEGAGRAWAGLLARRSHIQADMLKAMEERFGEAVWSFPEMGDVVRHCARLATGTKSSYGSNREAGGAFCFGAARLDDALWQDPTLRKDILTEMRRWLQRERGDDVARRGCAKAVFMKDSTVFDGAPPAAQSLVGGIAWMEPRPYWQWIKHREDASAWWRGGHGSREEGWDDGGTFVQAGAWLGTHVPEVARAVAMLEQAKSDVPDFSKYRQTLDAVAKEREGVDTLANALTSHPQWLRYRDPNTGMPALLTLCKATKPALLRRAMVEAEKEPQWREAVGSVSGYGIGVWEYVVTHGYGDSWTRLLTEGIDKKPFVDVLAKLAPPRAGWLTRAILWQKPSFSLDSRKKLAALLREGDSSDMLFGDAATRKRLVAAARGSAEVAQGVCNACCVIDEAVPGIRLSGDLLLAGLVGMGMGCRKKNQMGVADIPKKAGQLLVDAIGTLAGNEAYPLARATDDLRKVREILEKGAAGPRGDQLQRGDALLEGHIALYTQLESTVAAALAQEQMANTAAKPRQRLRA